MDKAERTRLKTLANDAVIATFGTDSQESRLAEALERCVDELEDIGDKCYVCSFCDNHGDHWDSDNGDDEEEVP